MTVRCWRRPCSWPRPAVPGGNCRRCSAPPVRRCTGASPARLQLGSGPSCTGRCWISSAPRVRSTGRAARSTRSVSGRLKGPLTGPNPTDRGKNGSKVHVICDRAGLPLSVGISAANVHDSQALVPLMRGIPPVRSRFGPRRRRPVKLHADKGYDFEHLRNWLRHRQVLPRIARRGVESSSHLGRHRWVTGRTMSWLNGCHRLHRRYERKAEHLRRHRQRPHPLPPYVTGPRTALRPVTAPTSPSGQAGSMIRACRTSGGGLSCWRC